GAAHGTLRPAAAAAAEAEAPPPSSAFEPKPQMFRPPQSKARPATSSINDDRGSIPGLRRRRSTGLTTIQSIGVAAITAAVVAGTGVPLGGRRSGPGSQSPTPPEGGGLPSQSPPPPSAAPSAPKEKRGARARGGEQPAPTAAPTASASAKASADPG